MKHEFPVWPGRREQPAVSAMEVISRRVALTGLLVGTGALLVGCSGSGRFRRIDYWVEALDLRRIGTVVDEDRYGSNNFVGSRPSVLLVERGDLDRVLERGQAATRKLGFEPDQHERVWSHTTERETVRVHFVDFPKGERWSFSGRDEIVTSSADSLLVWMVVATA